MNSHTRKPRAGRLGLILGVLTLFALFACAGGAWAMTNMAASTPWIQTDKADYTPGSTVHLTGGNWQPGEDVQVSTNDTVGNTWSQTDHVTADGGGNIADDIVLPNYFISDYGVTATGSVSGATTTAFTDKSQTTDELSSSGNPSVSGSSVTFTATETGIPSAGTPTGTITFMDKTGGGQGTTLCQVSLTNTGTPLVATATCVAPNLPLGARAISSHYGGNTNYNAGDATLTQTVNPRPPSNLQAAANGRSEVDLSWTASPDASNITDYVIFEGASQVATAAKTATSAAITGLAGGTTHSYTVKARFTSGADFLSSAAGPASATTSPSDSTPPVITPVVSPSSPNGSNGWYASGDVTVSFTVSDPESAVTSRSAACATDSTTTTVSSDGTTSVVCSATSSGGTSSSTQTIKRDVTIPTVALDALPASTAAATIDVSGSATDATSGVAGVAVNGSAATFVNTTGAFSRLGVALACGANTISAVSTDRAGNPSAAATASITRDCDTTPPVTTDDAPADWSNAAVTVQLTATDTGLAASGVKETFFKVDSGSFTSGSSVMIGAPADHSNDGTHTISYYATDNAGNAETPHSAMVKIDTTPPGSLASAGSATVTNSSPFTISYSASDPGSDRSGLDKVELFVKRPGDSSYSLSATDSSGGGSGSFSYSPAAGEGTYSFYTRAADKAGNLEVPPGAPDAQVQVLLDTTPPSTGDNAPSAWQNSAVTVTLTAGDGPAGSASGVKETFFKVDSGSFTSGSSVVIGAPADHSNDGAHTISYYSTDNAGNAETPHSATVKIDTTPPTIDARPAGDSCSVPGANGWCRGVQTAGFSASDTLSGLADTTKASFTNTTSSNGSAVTIASGPVADSAGNTAPSIDGGPFKIDSVVPSLAPAVSPNPVILNGIATAAVNAADGTSLIDSANTGCNAVVTSSPGQQTVTCHASDNAGNTSSATARYTVGYNFVGFLSPLNSDTSIVNTGNAGRTYPLKWQLKDANGNYIADAVAGTTVASQRMSCTDLGTSLTDPIDATATGSTSLRYDPTSNQYIYNWATPSTKSTCYRLVVTPPSGIVHTALFKLN